MMDTIFSWATLWWILIVLYVPACLGLIVIVLLQKGKGTGFAGAFGAGAGPGADAVFGPKSGQSLPVKMTYAAAGVFMLFSVIMSVVSGKVGSSDAPDLVDEDGATIAATTVLSELGLGTGIVDAARHDGSAPSQAVQDAEEALDEAGEAAMVTETVGEADETVDETAESEEAPADDNSDEEKSE